MYFDISAMINKMGTVPNKIKEPAVGLFEWR
jgi:hypothetical protein